MKKAVILFILALCALAAGAFALSYTGALLPGPDDASKVSLRDVQQRRSHFVTYYAFGK